CPGARNEESAAPTRPASAGGIVQRDGVSVVLITIDGVRAREVFSGVDPELARRDGLTGRETVSKDELTPHLQRLIQRGVGIGVPGHGAPFRVSGRSHVSLPGYFELVTGTDPAACPDNRCRPFVRRTLIDDFRTAFDLPREKVAVFSSWPPI